METPIVHWGNEAIWGQWKIRWKLLWYIGAAGLLPVLCTLQGDGAGM